MKKLISLLLIAAMLTGCSAESNHRGKWSKELENLMAEVNTEHEAVDKASLDGYEQYVQTPVKAASIKVADANPDGSFSLAQAEADTVFFFDYLRGSYGMYDYFGGDEVFDKAEEAILNELRNESALTKEKFSEIVVEYLDFIEDMHFRFDEKRSIGMEFPYFYMEVPFSKTEQGYETPDGKLVSAVTGYENLDELFKRSLSIDGDIVYYPIVIDEWLSSEDNDPEPLHLCYTDGTTQTLISDGYQSALTDVTEKEMTRMEDWNGIPSFISLGCQNKAFAQSGSTLKEEAIAIMDMRFNGGGNFEILRQWFENYTENEITGNLIALTRNPNDAGLAKQGRVTLEKGYAALITEDSFVENDRLLIVLTSKNSASGAEAFTDMVHNVENTLIIGENTAGCLSASGGNELTLPNSRLKFKLGSQLMLWPEGQFKEGYGLEPDLWCPASIAEEAAINFIKKNVK